MKKKKKKKVNIWKISYLALMTGEEFFISNKASFHLSTNRRIETKKNKYNENTIKNEIFIFLAHL